jgi:CspA family cold shock protein
MNNIYKGVVAFYNVGRQYGFIIENSTGRSYFCHNNTLVDHIKKGDSVTFELLDDPRGPVANKVKIG